MITMYDTPSYNIKSFDNGLSVEFINKTNDDSLLFQGEDASLFIGELVLWKEWEPERTLEHILSELWFDYSSN